MYQIGTPDIFADFLATEEVGVALKGLDGRYRYANAGFSRLLQLGSQVTVLGQQDGELLPEAAASTLLKAQQACTASRHACSVELPLSDGAGDTRILAVTQFPVLDNKGDMEAVGVVVVPQAVRPREAREANKALRSVEAEKAQLESTVRSLEELASTDGLTKAWNRRRFEEAVEGETHRAVRFGHPISLAMIDIDHFKSVNDNYGHPAGDRILAEFAECLREGMRKSDSLTRWGGEEFIILMPNTPLSSAQRFAERLRERIEYCQFRDVGALTASFGVAQFAPSETVKEWLRRVDDALYRAKKKGRNLVETDSSKASGSTVEHVEGNFVRLVWKQRFCSGHPMIDAQHQALFESANHLLDGVMSGRPAAEVELLIEHLIGGVARHFRDEEQLLQQVGFAGREEHKQEHAALLDRARSMLTEFRGGELSSGEIFQFLAYDLVARHMLGSDRQFFSSLATTQD